MKRNRVLTIKTQKLITILALYYIVGSKNLFLYILSLTLYNIFSACFEHISIRSTLMDLNSHASKKKIFRLTLTVITFFSFIFLLLSILASDLLSIFLKIDNILIIFVFMGISVITKPLIILISEYLENIRNNHKILKLIEIYYELDCIFLLLISLIAFRVFNINSNIAVALLYLPKILSAIIIIITLYLLTKNKKKIPEIKESINYKKEIKKILTNNNKSIVNIIKNSYYYISIIVLYVVLSTRYSYNIDELENIIVFVYFYAINLVDYVMYLTKLTISKLPQDMLPTDKMYYSFKTMLEFAIIFSIISPLTCKVIFYDPEKAIYLTMVNFMGIFILLYDVTYSYIKNKIIINASLIAGLIVKIILIIPLINSFYRMGYNLIYGDILSTMIALFTSVIICYIYFKNINRTKSNYFERILAILYESILLSIILLLVEFIIPIDTKSYFKSLGLIIIYMIISISFIQIKNKK